MNLLNQKGQIVGRLIGDTYESRRKPEHFMRIFQGFGISLPILEKLREKNCKSVLIIYFGAKGIIKYQSPLSSWFESSKQHTFMEEDLQYFLSVSEMEEIK